jgi:hypothetical protein
MERNASAVRGTEFGTCDKYVLGNVFGLILQNFNIILLRDPNKFVT